MPRYKVCLIAVKDKDFLHDASIHDRTKLREVLTDRRRLACLGPHGLAVAAIIVADYPVGPPDG